jgi:hypothetical protein
MLRLEYCARAQQQTEQDGLGLLQAYRAGQRSRRKTAAQSRESAAGTAGVTGIIRFRTQRLVRSGTDIRVSLILALQDSATCC